MSFTGNLWTKATELLKILNEWKNKYGTQHNKYLNGR